MDIVSHGLTCCHQIGDDTIIDVQVTFVFTQIADIVAPASVMQSCRLCVFRRT